MIEESPPDYRASATGTAATLRRWFDDGLLRRIFRNAGALLGGKTLAGLLALGTLAVTARGLGPELFGALILIHTYVKFVGGITKFQSWQAVIRYGAASLGKGRRGDVQRLIKFTALLDLTSAAVGVALAAAMAPLVAPWLGWDGDAVPLAVAYSALILFTVKATPIGVLRLFDRFNLLAVQATFSPAAGLIGACIVYALGGGLAAFLAVWFIAGAVDGASLVALGWRELARQGLLRGIDVSLRRLTKPHPGLWRFVLTANVYSSLSAASGHLVTLAVGWLLGPAAAGLFKIASQFAGVLVVPAGLLRRTIYPELAKLTAQGSAHTVRRVMLRAGVLAGSAAALAVLVLAVLGEPLIRLTVGEAYVGASGVLVLLALATTVSVYGVALEPVFFAIGRPGTMLRVSAVMTVFNLVLLVFLVAALGLIGAGVAMVAGTVIGIGILTMLALRHLAKHARGERESSPVLDDRAGFAPDGAATERTLTP